VHGNMITDSGISGPPRRGSFSLYAMRTDGWTIAKVEAIGEGPGGIYNHLIGPSGATGFDYFMPTVVNEDPLTQDFPEIYPVGFTLDQLFEIEYLAKYLFVDLAINWTDTGGGFGGYADSIQVDNCHGDVANFGVEIGDPDSIPDARYVLRRAGLWQGAGRSNETSDSFGNLITVATDSEISIGRQEVSGEVYPKSQWYNGSTPFNDIPGVTLFFMVAGSNFPGPRICYSGGLYYPAMYVAYRTSVTRSDGAGPGKNTFYASANLAGLGLSGGGPDVTLWGVDDLWSVTIPMLSDTFDVGPYTATGTMEIHLSPWPELI
jgi:hypothetical protein